MKTFYAEIVESFIFEWECPYCSNDCESNYYKNPEEQDFVECEYCGEKAKCKGVEDYRD